METDGTQYLTGEMERTKGTMRHNLRYKNTRFAEMSSVVACALRRFASTSPL